ncbi:MAG: energy transducer TonB [Luteibacter sp.]
MISASRIAAVPRRAIIVVAVTAVLLVAALVLGVRQQHELAEADAPAKLPEPAVTTGASPEIDILLGLARDATKDGRLVAPQGNNAYEYYLSILQLDAKNATATDALRETLPFASQTIERQINRRDLEEARREIALLRDFDPTNYTLIILGAKLDAQQQVVTAEDEAKADAMRRKNGS